MYNINLQRKFFEGRALQILSRRTPPVPLQCVGLKALTAEEKQGHFARIAVRPNISEQITIGGFPTYRYYQDCFIEIFSPKNTGLEIGGEIINDLLNGFKTPISDEDKAELARYGISRPAKLEIDTPDWNELGEDYDKVGGEENVYRQTIVFPFRIDYLVPRDVV